MNYDIDDKGSNLFCCSRFSFAERNVSDHKNECHYSNCRSYTLFTRSLRIFYTRYKYMYIIVHHWFMKILFYIYNKLKYEDIRHQNIVLQDYIYIYCGSILWHYYHIWKLIVINRKDFLLLLLKCEINIPKQPAKISTLHSLDISQ